MRTTIDLDYSALRASQEIGGAENISFGKVISLLVRQALMGASHRRLLTARHRYSYRIRIL